MAKYDQLPVYRKSFELAVYIEQTVHGFSKHHKYGLGARLQHAAMTVLEKVIRAQNAEGVERARELRELRIEGEVLKNLLHLAMEVRAFKSFGACERAAGMAIEICRQTEGWLRHTLPRRLPESRPTNPQGGRS